MGAVMACLGGAGCLAQVSFMKTIMTKSYRLKYVRFFSLPAVVEARRVDFAVNVVQHAKTPRPPGLCTESCFS